MSHRGNCSSHRDLVGGREMRVKGQEKKEKRNLEQIFSRRPRAIPRHHCRP